MENKSPGLTSSRISIHATPAQRVRHELVQFLIISGYLYLYFGAIIFYKASILNGEGISFAPFGLAIVKALILGKFILMGHALKFGERGIRFRLVLDILYKSLLFLIMLVILSIAEDVAVDFVHGSPIREALTGFAGGSLQQAFAVSLLMLLVLIPYFAFREIARSMGEGRLLKLLIDRPLGDADA
jgi:hypothetical protein